MTKLTRWEELVYLNKFLSLLFQFILQECGEHSPTVISNGLSKVQRLCHILHIQGFNTNNIIFVCKFVRTFVQEVLALISNLLMEKCYLATLFLAVVAPFLAET